MHPTSVGFATSTVSRVNRVAVHPRRRFPDYVLPISANRFECRRDARFLNRERLSMN